MKPGHYFFALALAVVCAVLSVTLILLAHNNQRLQVRLQAQQQVIDRGILGQQAQQISDNVLQDLANLAINNAGIRQLLEKHGYSVSSSKLEPAINLSEQKKTESTNIKTLIP